jgi:hypothetical protein
MLRAVSGFRPIPNGGAAQALIAKLPAVYAAPAVHALNQSSRPEVAAFAGRTLANWQSAFDSAFLERIFATEDFAPWEWVQEFELSRPDPVAFARRVGPTMVQLIRAKYGDGFISVFDYPSWQIAPGQLSVDLRYLLCGYYRFGDE